MRPHLPAALAIILLAGAGARAQQPSSGTKPPPAATANEIAPPGDSDPRGQPVNVRLELTITDQIGPGEPARKTVAMIVADRSSGSIRSAGNNIRAVLNVDATPHILPNGNIRLQLGMEYNPRQSSSTPQTVKSASGDAVHLPPDQGGSSLNQRVTIVLEPGKPLVVSQAADPISERRITVEVRAAILK